MFLPFAALCVCLFFSVSLPEIKVPWIAIGDDIFYKGEANLITTLGMLGLLVSLCFIALSREKDEDEMTGQIRMQSFVNDESDQEGREMKNTVKVERAIKDITQQELAAAVGVSRQTINSIEAGGYIPSGVLVLKIARYFGKPVESIFELEEND